MPKVLARFGGLVALAAAAAFLFLQSGFFRLERLAVTGNHRVSQDEVALLAGVTPGARLYSLRLDDVASRIERNPWIRDAQVSRRWPATLVVKVTERQPVALIPYYQYFLAVDRDGVALGLVQDMASLEVPIIGGIPSSRVLLGRPYPVDKLKVGLQCLKALGKPWVDQVSDLDLSGDQDLTMFLRGPVEVRLTQSGDLTGKMQTLATILADAQAKGLKLAKVDLRWDGQPVITLKNQAAGGGSKGTAVGGSPVGGTPTK